MLTRVLGKCVTAAHLGVHNGEQHFIAAQLVRHGRPRRRILPRCLRRKQKGDTSQRQHDLAILLTILSGSLVQ